MEKEVFYPRTISEVDLEEDDVWDGEHLLVGNTLREWKATFKSISHWLEKEKTIDDERQE